MDICIRIRHSKWTLKVRILGLLIPISLLDSISGVAGANAGKLMGAAEADQDDNNSVEEEEEEEEDDFDLAEFQRVDNNLCSVLGEPVRFWGCFVGFVRS
jgi:hypothetical protein